MQKETLSNINFFKWRKKNNITIKIKYKNVILKKKKKHLPLFVLFVFSVAEQISSGVFSRVVPTRSIGVPFAKDQLGIYWLIETSELLFIFQSLALYQLLDSLFFFLFLTTYTYIQPIYIYLTLTIFLFKQSSKAICVYSGTTDLNASLSKDII